MTDSEKKRFYEAITLTFTIYGKEVKANVLDIFWNDLKEFSLDSVLKALNDHRRSSKFFPTIADIIERIPASKDGQHIGADEAWSIAFESFDEANTVVMTQEIATARGIAMEIYQDGNRIAARMAFKDAYNRLIDQSDAKPEWFISQGFDKSLRHAAVEHAKSLGRLPQAKYQNFIEHNPPPGEPTKRTGALIHIADIRRAVGKL